MIGIQCTSAFPLRLNGKICSISLAHHNVNFTHPALYLITASAAKQLKYPSCTNSFVSPRSDATQKVRHNTLLSKMESWKQKPSMAGRPTTINISFPSLAKMIDHSLLHPTMTDDEVLAGLETSKKYNVATGTFTLCP